MIFRNIILSTILILASACSEFGMRGMNCKFSDEALRDAAYSFIDRFPQSYEALDRTDIICVPEPHYYSYGKKVAGETLWPGSILARARIKIATGDFQHIEDTAAIHEWMHLYLWDVNKYPCYDHTESCGWDELAIEELRSRS
jgi:hypothetical protein